MSAVYRKVTLRDGETLVMRTNIPPKDTYVMDDAEHKRFQRGDLEGITPLSRRASSPTLTCANQSVCDWHIVIEPVQDEDNLELIEFRIE